MILIINICKEPLHSLEFVKPIEDILKKQKTKFQTKHYKKLTKTNINKADKIIITGTSLKDNEFIKNINKFKFIKTIDKSILGICGGMQIIGLIYNNKLKKKTEIGYFKEDFKKPFLNLKNTNQVYHLHNNYTTLDSNFITHTTNKIPQAIKHKTKPIYGVLFHPEVRNKSLINNFLKV